MFFIHMDFMVNTYGGNLNVQEKNVAVYPSGWYTYSIVLFSREDFPFKMFLCL